MMSKNTKGLSVWQLVMLALGTVIGGSFFLGSSVAIRAAGPSIILAYMVCGVFVYFILFALSEMTVANPDTGSFRTYAAQAFGKGTGFVVGWVYWTGMALAMSSEATAVSILVRQWFPTVSLPLLGSGIIVLVTLLNLLGADRLSKLESGLAAIKLFAIISFVIVGILLLAGLLTGKTATGLGSLRGESLMPGGIKGLAGSLLIVMFAYAGFEIIGLAASETYNPQRNIPRAIRNTVISLVGLFMVSITIIILLIPTGDIPGDASSFVAALNRQGIGWAGTAMNLVMVTAILSTMLASMFGLGRMMRSLANEGLAPAWLKDKRNVPYRGIICSGAAMLTGLGLGRLFPSIYLFLISSGGFSILFTYIVIMATHMHFRQKNGCPDGRCQLWGYPYTSIFVLLGLGAAIASMPFISGQASGLVAGMILIVFFALWYAVLKFARSRQGKSRKILFHANGPKLSTEISKELADSRKHKTDRRKENK